jgi:hypothetical protein
MRLMWASAHVRLRLYRPLFVYAPPRCGDHREIWIEGDHDGAASGEF